MEQAKHYFPKSEVYLIAGVHSDTVVTEYKRRPVMSEFERADTVRHCRHVDEVILDLPWLYARKFLIEHKIDFIAHDDLPYPVPGVGDAYAMVKSEGMFLPTNRHEGCSTTDIIDRILGRGQNELTKG